MIIFLLKYFTVTQLCVIFFLLALMFYLIMVKLNHFHNKTNISIEFAKKDFILFQKYFDRYYVKNIKIPDEFNIDLSQYNDSGITLQNMLEIQVIMTNMRKLMEYFYKTYPKGDIKIVMNKPLVNNNIKTKIQTNPDGIATMIYSHSGKTKINHIDAKIIQHPEKNLSVIGGNISIAYNYDTLLHANRFRGMVLNAINQQKVNPKFLADYMSELEYLLKKKPIGYLDIIKEIFHAIWCDPLITDFVPSIITETPIYSSVVFDNDHINLLRDNLERNNQELHLAKLFPEMGKERDDYHYQINNFIDNLPREINYDLKTNYTNFLEIMKMAAITDN